MALRATTRNRLSGAAPLLDVTRTSPSSWLTARYLPVWVFLMAMTVPSAMYPPARGPAISPPTTMTNVSAGRMARSRLDAVRSLLIGGLGRASARRDWEGG